MEQFRTQIFAVIHQIPHGTVTTYGQIAKMAGYPGYARHVGKALSDLPKSSTLPWHRVINGKGEISLTGERFSVQRAKLLEEGIIFTASGKVSLRTYGWQL
ncbi:MGMT family protein [Vibrio methylphosphonaticus]|uniref:MGMT family protein n=1 Tax=Vibrio methylphosphonaticus TaxID=2946866 RepID=UPI00202A11D0|nr:MGMT family protein [Vibrio methylphosphonaticus]MCL9776097.1 MGMT family protein [Vibrio methylphosphonaticus]